MSMVMSTFGAVGDGRAGVGTAPKAGGGRQSCDRASFGSEAHRLRLDARLMPA
jgi:hypothetical protein